MVGLHRCLLEAALAGCAPQVEEIWYPTLPPTIHMCTLEEHCEHMCWENYSEQVLHSMFHVFKGSNWVSMDSAIW